MKKLNNKGYMNLHIAIGVLIVSGFIMLCFYIPLLQTYNSVNINSYKIEPYITTRNGLERLYSKFYNNMSYNEFTSFTDLNVAYQIKEVEVETRNININSSSDTVSFLVNNKTDIKIDLDYTDLTELPEQVSYYSIKLYYEDELLFNESGLSGDYLITIPSDIVYNDNFESSDYGQYRYGQYKLIINSVNCSTSSNISYQEQSYREIEIIENDVLKRTLILKNNTSLDGDIQMYFIKNKEVSS